MENRYDELLALGICTRCKKRTALPGQRRCGLCVQANREEYQRKRARMTPEELAEYNRKAAERMRANPKNRARQKVYEQEIRRKVIEAYGGKCACCGEATYEFLILHHPKNDGGEHRREVMGGKEVAGWAFAYKMWKAGTPPGLLQVLCGSCHNAITHYGACPHSFVIA